MSLRRIHSPAERALVVRIGSVAEACRPMADYLFEDALGTSPSDELLREAKHALMPLRCHPGLIGRAVVVLLEGGVSPADYDEAVRTLLQAATGPAASEPVESWGQDPRNSYVPTMPEYPVRQGDQLTLPGFDS